MANVSIPMEATDVIAVKATRSQLILTSALVRRVIFSYALALTFALERGPQFFLLH